ncbi:MAG: DUF423 domain-containing protein [Leptospira sp.]|jgi:uncharacterized membrane protein YgdD (TMEM256/DUF423 family)|nr:DUF423 domain-containing protein [Leptospira sp.]
MYPVNNQSIRLQILIVTILGFLAVGIGAFGAHGLKSIIGQDRMPIFETGNKYHFYHTLVSVLIIITSRQIGFNRKLNLAFLFFVIGIFLFSFSLYALAITGIKTLGIITPFGGVSFLIGWILFGLGSLQSREEP